MSSVSVVIPVFNSANSIVDLHGAVHEALSVLPFFEIIYVDDGSTDNSWELLKNVTSDCASCKGIQLGRNSGQTSATIEGLRLSRYEFVFTMDDDLQHNPQWVVMFTEELSKNRDIDAVIAEPIAAGHHWMRFAGSKALNLFRKLVRGKSVPHFSSFRGMRKSLAARVANAGQPRETVSSIIYSLTGRTTNIRVVFAKRFEGTSSYTPLKLLKLVFMNLAEILKNPSRKMAIMFIGAILALSGSLVYAGAYLAGVIGLPGFATTAMLLSLVLSVLLFIGAILFSIQNRLDNQERPYIRDSFGYDEVNHG